MKRCAKIDIADTFFSIYGFLYVLVNNKISVDSINAYRKDEQRYQGNFLSTYGFLYVLVVTLSFAVIFL